MTSADLAALADELDAALRTSGTLQRAEHEQRYLRSQLRFYGTSVPAARAAAKAVAKRTPDLDHDALLSLVSDLWARGVHECRVASVELLRLYPSRLGPADAAALEQFVRESKTWALVDALSTGVIAELVERCDGMGPVLDRWAVDSDFWVRRCAVLALLPALRRGGGDVQRFGRYADAMLDEKEFFIRKAIGWVLRDLGRRNPTFVTAWLAARTSRASGVTMREAVKYLPETDRDRLMDAYRRKVDAT